MAFLPFGEAFEITSPLSATEVRAAIRKRGKRWFDSGNGARGWVVGPVICLWWSPTDRWGPMVVGWISEQATGSKVSGRAGSDLNGVALTCVLVPVMVLSLSQMLLSGGYQIAGVLVGGGVLLLMPLVFWSAHRSRREAQPIVRFLRNAVVPTRRVKVGEMMLTPGLTLTVSGWDQIGPVTPQGIQNALLELGEGDSVVLASGPETYIQTIVRDGEFIIEMREGSRLLHSQAVRREAGERRPDQLFSFDETRSAFLAFASQTPMPKAMRWKSLKLPD